MSDCSAEPARGITVNGQARPLPAMPTLLALLEESGLAHRPVAVELDGEVVPRGRFAAIHLAGGERIEIVTFVGGG